MYLFPTRIRNVEVSLHIIQQWRAEEVILRVKNARVIGKCRK